MPTMTSTNLKLIAVLVASGIEVNLFRKAASPQMVVGEFQNTPAIVKLISDYEKRRVISVPQKSVLQAYQDLSVERLRLIMEAL
ncbi:MAG: DUF5659 domain-containing protein [Desulfuromonadaceae bacterium]